MSGDAPPRYVGPSMADLLHPAAWATRLGPPQLGSGRGRRTDPPMTLRAEFIAQFIMIILEGKTLFLSRRNPTRFYTEEQFNALVRPFCHRAVPSPASMFKAQGFGATVYAIAYEPDQPLIMNIGGELAVNTWVRPRIPITAGDVSLWMALLAHLFPVEDERHQVMRWIATLIARPRVRMKYGLLLASTMQGVGKTTLCDILRVLVGLRNSGSPSAKEVVESAFTAWIGHKRLVVVNEIYEGRDKQAYHKLKSFVTDETVRVNEKFLPQYEIRNWAHFVLCSNSELALRIEQDDRRFLVPTVTEKKQSPAFWEQLHNWLAGGGYSAIAHWAHDFAGEPGNAVRPSVDAPATARKRQMIEDSRSPEERLVSDLAALALASADASGSPVVLVEGDVADWVRLRRADAPRKPVEVQPHTIRRWLRGAGLKLSDRIKIDGRKQHAAGTLPLEGLLWSDISMHRVRPDDLEGL